MSDDIVWEEPPPRTRGTSPGKTQRFVEALRGRPGQWAVYPHPVNNKSGSAYRRNHPGTEWTTRTRPDGTCVLYARWVGEEGTA